MILSLNSFIKPAAVGAAIGLLVIGLFLSQTHGGKPEFGPYWMLRPLLIVPVATAFGGAAFKLISSLIKRGWSKVALTILGGLIFIVSLWLGTVLGLVGTYWD